MPGKRVGIAFRRADGEWWGVEAAFFRACRAGEIASGHVDDECRHECDFFAEMKEMLVDGGCMGDAAETSLSCGSVDAALTRAKSACFEPFFKHGYKFSMRSPAQVAL